MNLITVLLVFLFITLFILSIHTSELILPKFYFDFPGNFSLTSFENSLTICRRDVYSFLWEMDDEFVVQLF